MLAHLGPTSFLIQEKLEAGAPRTNPGGELECLPVSELGPSGVAGGSDSAATVTASATATARRGEKFRVKLGVPFHTCSCRTAASTSTLSPWCVHIAWVVLKVLKVPRDH